MNQANMQQTAAGQSAMTRLQEQNSKQQQLANVLAQQRAGSEQMYGADVSGFGAQNSAITTGQLGAENINAQTAQANNKQQQGMLGGLLGGLGGGAQYAKGGEVTLADALASGGEIDSSVDPTPINLSPAKDELPDVGRLPVPTSSRLQALLDAAPSEPGTFPVMVQSGLSNPVKGSRLSESGYSTQLPQGYPRNQPMEYLPGMTKPEGMLTGDMPSHPIGAANQESWDQFNKQSEMARDDIAPYKMDAQDQQSKESSKDGKQGNFWLNMLMKLGTFAALKPQGGSVTPRPYDEGGYVDEKPSDYAMNIPQGASSSPSSTPSSSGGGSGGNSGMQGLSTIMSLASMLDRGGEVPGHARYHGDNFKNDTEPAILSKKEIVLPRTVTLDDDAPTKAAEFVAGIKGHGDVKDPAARYHAQIDELEDRLKKLESLVRK